jgi:adenosylcobyric acid synthase
VNYRAGVEAVLDGLADGLDACLDIDALFNLK